MRERSVAISSVLFTALAATAACAPEVPVEPAILAQRAALMARNTGLLTARATGFAGGHNSTLKGLASSLALAREDLGAALPSPLPSPLLAVLGKNSFFDTLFDAKSQLTLEQKLNEISINLERWVKERLLAQENLEEKGESEATYLLKGDPTCRPLVAPGVTPPPPDPECTTKLEKIEARVLMKALLDGILLRFVVGPDRLEVSSILLRLDGLEWHADLGKSTLSTEYVNAALGDTNPGAARFAKLAGKTIVNVTNSAATGVTVTASISEALDIVRTDAAGKPLTTLKVAASTTPVLALSGDNATKTLVLQLGLGATTLETAWDPNRSGAVNLDHAISFTAVSARGRLVESARELRLTEVLMADYAETVRGVKTLSVKLNPDSGGKVDAVVKLDPAGMPSIEVSPKLEISALFAMAGLAPDFKAVPKPYLPDETFALVLDGGDKPGKVRIVEQRGAFAGIAVEEGTLRVTSTKSETPLAVPSGKCLARLKSPPPNGHPLLRLLAAVDCPVRIPTTSTTGGNAK